MCEGGGPTNLFNYLWGRAGPLSTILRSIGLNVIARSALFFKFCDMPFCFPFRHTYKWPRSTSRM